MIADDDESLIFEAGFRLRRRNTRRSEAGLEKGSGARVKAGLLPGEAILRYNAVSGARMYAIEWSTDNGAHWQNGIYSTTLRAFITGLPIRQDILLRVYAIGTGQRKGAASDAVGVFLV